MERPLSTPGLLCAAAALLLLAPPARSPKPLCYWGPPGPTCGPYCETCGPGHETCGPSLDGPRFHVRDDTCGTQDPNAPVYDPLHGVYHLFWQAHTARPCAGDFKAAPSIGHAVSRDLVRWAHLPVAIWNGGDEAYDADAIYSCSATLVDGVPTIVYPGLCESSSWAGGLCKTWPGKGTTLGIATPANRSDPLSREWAKSALNPIANRTTDAPSTAWRTAGGEWRFVTSGSGTNWVWSSRDFRSWTHVGNLSGFAGGACPSLFPMPPLTAGAGGELPAGATHVAKTSLGTAPGVSHMQDVFMLGKYTDGSPGTAGEWKSLAAPAYIDRGQLFAGKDMWDPVKGRRLYWAWAHDVLPASALTLAREVTWHGVLQQFIFAPIEEQQALRGAKLASVGRRELPAGGGGGDGRRLWLSEGWAHGAGNQSEVQVTFALPAKPARLGVLVMSSSIGAEDGDVSAEADGTLFYADFVPPPASGDAAAAWTVEVGAMDVHAPKGAADVGDRDEMPDAGLRVRSRGPPPFWPPYTDKLRLLPTDTNLSFSIFVDHTFAECFFAGGRTVLTRSVGRAGARPAAGMAVVGNASAGVPLTVEAADVWKVDSIWIDPEEVLASPRPVASPSAARSKDDDEARARGTAPYSCADTMLNAVTQFGCQADGVSDDTACLQRAVDAAISCKGKAVFLPVGTYRLSSHINISGHMQLIGEGASGSCHGEGNFSTMHQHGTVLQQTNPEADVLVIAVPSDCESVQLRDFSLFAKPQHSSGAAVHVVSETNCLVDAKFERLLIDNFQTGVHCECCQNAALNDLKIRRSWGVGVLIEGSPTIPWSRDVGDSRIAGLDFFGCKREYETDGCNSHAGVEYREGGSWFITQSKILLGEFGVLLNQSRAPTGTLMITTNSFEEQRQWSIAFLQGLPENLTYSGYANVVVSNNELSNLDDFSGGHLLVDHANAGTTVDRTWMRNMVVTGNVVNSGVNASIPLFNILDGIGCVVSNNVLNNNGAKGPSALYIAPNITGVKCSNNVAVTAHEDLACEPAACCV